MNTTLPPKNVVDTSSNKLVPPPGLTKPSYSTQYTSSIIHKELSRYYGDLFPQIITTEDEVKYALDVPGRNDPTLTATPVKNITEIPESEVFKMLEGWIRMRQDLRNGDVHERAHSLLLNFRVPNPAKHPENYRIYRHQEEDHLLIFWGFEKVEGSSVSLEQAMSMILNIPVSRLQSILSASLLSCLPKNLREIPEAQPANIRQSPSPINKNWYSRITFNQIIMGAAAAILLFAITMTFIWTTSTPGSKSNKQNSIRDLSGKTYPLPENSVLNSPHKTTQPVHNPELEDHFANADRWQ